MVVSECDGGRFESADDRMDDMPLEGHEIGGARNFQARARKVMRQSCLNGLFLAKVVAEPMQAIEMRGGGQPSVNGYVSAWVRRCDSKFRQDMGVPRDIACRRVQSWRRPPTDFPAALTTAENSNLCRADAGRAAARQCDRLRQDAVSCGGRIRNN
ncbi:hypothetical protein ACH79_41145 [Bradyrhizobium sp. CCBAU 051011]|nr:hypothetical protein ACH79_41145 [Bradyrhizobium sp. CCBAU 051011]